jgi:hypothetical protein
VHCDTHVGVKSALDHLPEFHNMSGDDASVGYEMANQKRKISISAIVVLAVMGIASVAWVVYLEPYAAPPLPQQSMPIVFNTSYDGSVWQIKDWFKKHILDYSTLQVLHWGKVTDAKDGFTVHVTFKAKNKAGNYVTSDEVFALDKQGNITGMKPFNPGKH